MTGTLETRGGAVTSIAARTLVVVVAGLVGILLVWRILVLGIGEYEERADTIPKSATKGTPAAPSTGDLILRNPVNYTAMLEFALQLERTGNRQAAIDAASQALR